MTTREDLLARLRIPVVAAPMFLVSGPELVVAACRAGVLGAFPTPNCRTTAQLDEWLATISSGVGEAPWAVNLVTHRTNTRLADDLALVAEYRPPVVITALGSPRPVMDAVHSYGGLVLADVINLSLAGKAIAAGADGLACVSAGAGGHTGFLSPFAFVSAVREVFDGLVAVGGGISDGYGVAGAVTAGADLVSMGTRFLATRESMAAEEYKQMVVEHGAEDLVVSAGITGAPASWLRPSLERNGLDPETVLDGAARYDGADTEIRRWRDIWAAGQGLGRIHTVEPVTEVVDTLVGEYREALRRASRLR